MEDTAMWSWFILAVMLICGILAFIFYIASVGPAVLEQKIGIDAYEVCARKRKIAAGLYSTFFLSYFFYAFFPLENLPIPRFFEWNYFVSFGLGVLVGFPSFLLLFKGIEDGGEESLTPRKEHGLYGGIYDVIRHPQIVGEYLSFWSFTFFLHSPFLSLLNFLWFPAFWLTIRAEERDLKVRYGEAYQDYIRQVGCVIPRLRAFKKKAVPDKE
ncbi:MAG: isoprenylcysteine carboxylmethyltransferase family protein [Anaerolineae bacterium]|nr:isoprenylcysteine carboxylmethyltransferase family protein [Anaerolineae bacterium]